MVKQNKGFTLIELLIIIGIIGFLAAAILVAVDPVRRIQEARDAKRFAEVNSILNAILTKQVDEKSYYTGVSDAPILPDTVLGTLTDPGPPAVFGGADSFDQVIVSSVGLIDCTDADLRPVCPEATLMPVVDAAGVECIANLGDLAPTYIASVPVDPHGAGWDNDTADTNDVVLGASNTGYFLRKVESVVGTPGNQSLTYTYTIGSCWPEQTGTIQVMR